MYKEFYEAFVKDAEGTLPFATMLSLMSYSYSQESITRKDTIYFMKVL